jgi:hypothetical protein
MAKSNDRGKYRFRKGAGRKIVTANLSRTDVGKFPLELQAEGGWSGGDQPRTLFSGIFEISREPWEITSRLRRFSSVIGIEYRTPSPVLEGANIWVVPRTSLSSHGNERFLILYSGVFEDERPIGTVTDRGFAGN